MDAELLKSFARWMEVTPLSKSGKRYKKNYIAHTIQKIRSAYRKAVKEGLARPVDLDYSYSMEPTNAVYLSEKELDDLYNFKFKSKSRTLIRDVFLIGCFTGMRAGNYLNLTEMNISLEGGYIETIMNKRGGRIRIPLHRIVRELIEKYGTIPQYHGGINTYNKVLRRLCKEAGINKMIQVESTRGGVREVYFVPKWELISSHTARRSMATNLYLRDVPIRYIMAITGHKTEEMCLLYIKAGISELYEQVAKLDFWK